MMEILKSNIVTVTTISVSTMSRSSMFRYHYPEHVLTWEGYMVIGAFVCVFVCV